MKKMIALLCCAGLIALSCESQKNSQDSSSTEKTASEKVPYKTAERYFLKNTASPAEWTTQKITTAEDFNALFGAAAVMGSNGTPTPIDFSKEFLLVIYAPTTSKETTLKPLRLQKNGSKLNYYYTVREGKELSFQTKPSSIIIVDKKYDGDVDFVKE